MVMAIGLDSARSATQDITIDALRIEQIDRANRAMAAGASMAVSWLVDRLQTGRDGCPIAGRQVPGDGDGKLLADDVC